MLRLLPYVIVSLLLFLGARLMDALNYNAANADIIVENVAENTAELKEDIQGDFLQLSDGFSVAVNDVASNDFGSVEKAVANTASDTNQITSPEGGSKQPSNDTTNKNLESPEKGKIAIDRITKDACVEGVEFSPITLDILQELKQRREELEHREQEFLLRINVLDVAKRDLEEKLSRLTTLQANLDVALRQYEEHEHAKTMKLVKIYENMKPSDAAKIFDDLQTFVILDVIEQMKEARLAPILASMEPEKAKEFTIGLINRRKAIQN